MVAPGSGLVDYNNCALSELATLDFLDCLLRIITIEIENDLMVLIFGLEQFDQLANCHRKFGVKDIGSVY
jgi:hypothetical protein